MAVALAYDWAGPEDLPALEAFQRRTYGPDAVQCLPGRTRWMYFEHPHGLHVALCRDGDEIVAACGHLPQRVALGGREVLAGFGVDFMVAASHRRLGIGRRFLEMRAERFELSLSTGQSPGMLALYRSCGAVDLGPLLEAVRRGLAPRPGTPRRMARDAALWWRSRGGEEPAADVAEMDPASALSTVGGGDPAWDRWRYAGAVYGDYRGWIAEEAAVAGRVAGPVLQVADARGARRAALLAALAEAAGVEEVRALGAGARLATDLGRAGFRVVPATARLVGLSREPAVQKALEAARAGDGPELLSGAADADLLRRPA